MLTALRTATCMQPTHVPTSHTQSYSLQDTVIKNRWKLLKVLGKGAFGEVYLAIDLSTKEHVAIKIEAPECKKPVLKLEVSVLQKLQSSSYVCKYISCGRFISPHNHPPPLKTNDAGTDTLPEKSTDDRIYSYLVMERLGPNLSDIRKQMGGKFSIATTALLAKHMLLGIEASHKIGILHRDIKPGNFCMAAAGSPYVDEYKRPRCFLIDFGLSRRYISSSGRVREPRSKVGFRGTARYASISAHHGTELCRADDLWSLFYIIVEFLTGVLPWRGKEKEKIGHMKKELTNPDLVSGLPSPVLFIHTYLLSLSYATVPDYQLILHFLDELFKTSNMPIDTPYDWDLNLPSSSASPLTEASETRVSKHMASSRMGSGQDDTPCIAIQLNNATLSTPDTPTVGMGKGAPLEIDTTMVHGSTPELSTLLSPTMSKTDFPGGSLVDSFGRPALPTTTYLALSVREPSLARTVRSISTVSTTGCKEVLQTKDILQTKVAQPSSHTSDRKCQPRWVNSLLDHTVGIIPITKLTHDSGLKSTHVRASTERESYETRPTSAVPCPMTGTAVSTQAHLMDTGLAKPPKNKKTRWWADFSICC
ncbi:hypothetical protein BASA81_004385 [Batrachochytrium salamandrivorans]|nr:hypothetical protein BASA81_004385 [Batrachochytrium salamandrivorans]